MTRSFVMIALLMFGCGYAKRPICESSLSGLRLAIEPQVSELTPGEATVVDLVLRNPDATSIRACVGSGWGVNIFGVALENKGTTVLGRDPLCEREFTLAAGETLRWQVEVQVPESRSGEGLLSGWVQVLDLRGCHGPCGCDSAIIRSEPTSVTIKE